MNEPNPFAGIKTYDNYTHIWQLTGFIILAQLFTMLLAALAVKFIGLRLDTYEAIIPAFVLTGYISWTVLDGLGVSWRAAWADWQANAVADLLKAFKYLAGYAGVLVAMFALLLSAYYIVGDGLIPAIDSVGSASAAQEASAKALSSSSLRFALLLVSTCLVAPVVEELFFRRIVFTALRRRQGFWSSAFWSSLLFSFFHGAAAPVILPCGIYLAWVYERERRLPINIMLHGMVNFLMMTYKVFS